MDELCNNTSFKDWTRPTVIELLGTKPKIISNWKWQQRKGMKQLTNKKSEIEKKDLTTRMTLKSQKSKTAITSKFAGTKLKVRTGDVAC